jgi:uncharacterized protein
MATNQEFMNFIRSEDVDAISIRNWVEINNFDINANIDMERTALHWLAYQGNERSVRDLLAAGANVEGLTAEGLERNEPTALSGAIVSQHTNIALILLNAGANPNLTNQYHTTAFHQAADEGNIDVVNAMLTTNPIVVDINLVNNTGRTGLQIAAEEHHYGVVDAINNYQAMAGIDGLTISGAPTDT